MKKITRRNIIVSIDIGFFVVLVVVTAFSYISGKGNILLLILTILQMSNMIRSIARRKKGIVNI